MAGEEAEVCIVGGGPAGMVAGLLFARAGVRTVVLEKHRDFLRDFRGDTVHPSTLRIFSELGLLDALLERPHDKVRRIGVWVGGRHFEVGDFSRFDSRWNFVAMMPQWEFLDFVAGAARRYPAFSLVMEAEATGLIREEGRVTGVRWRHDVTTRETRAKLVIAADGRRSVIREEASLPVLNLGAPMDIFWFRVPKARAAENETTGIFTGGRIMALIDRGDYWQCAYVFPKGSADAVRGRGIETFRSEVAEAAPMLAAGIAEVRDWQDVQLLTVALDRLERWHDPGLLVIGDAAHAMSPIGGLGVNVAIQDAVAAANIISAPLAEGRAVDALLPRVQARRLPSVRFMQGFQNAAQKNIISPLLASSSAPASVPLPLRLLDRHRFLRRLPAALIGFGPRAEHVRSPQA
jgi:2-polyprenyl-6-methoxyphenol hydroxylase-like FAD-dependent oxidoreductase